MRIAFVDNLPVGGGLSRFSYMLCKSLLEEHKSVQIDYYVHETNLVRTPEIKALTGNIRVKLLEASRMPSLPKRMASKIGGKLGMVTSNGDPVMREVESKIKGYDVAYFPSAHMMPRPNLSVPVTGTIHDFNWKYFFGRQIFPSAFVEQMDSAVVQWMQSSPTACSSHDVVTEAKKLYPGIKNYPNVVHLAPVAFSHDISEPEAEKALGGLGIDYPYIIFPGNFFPHKNHLNLFSAFALLKKRKGFADMKLILTGMHTDQIAFGIAERTGVQLVTKNSPDKYFDVRGLGYQPNQVIDALIKKARLLVSPSLYEAICTPGMDAWHFGTPTAISDIPPFREHEQVWGVRSAFFDPMNPLQIADTLEQYLNNYSTAREDGNISQQNIAKYTWDKVAKGYLQIFQKTISTTA